jgi:hypothetical protein
VTAMAQMATGSARKGSTERNSSNAAEGVRTTHRREAGCH